MVIFNALLNLRELKELYSGKPVCVCPLYKGSIGSTKRLEATGNPVVIPEYVALEKLNIEFLPNQSGNGDPSPENVRAITGLDSVKVTISNGDVSHDYDITLPETIYGGTVDAVTGVGSKTWEFVEFDGTEDWYQNGENGYFLGEVIDIGLSGNRESISNIAVNSGNSIAPIPDGQFNTWSFTFQRGWCGFSLSFADSLDSWKSYLAAQASAGTPVQVAYKIATPTPFEISKISIPSLKGENTIFTSGKNMDIIYKESIFWSDEA